MYHGEWIADEAQEIPQGYLNVGNVDDERANEDWLKDPGEVGRRMLEWWKNGLVEAIHVQIFSMQYLLFY